MSKEVVIVSAVRTAIGAFGGSLKNSSAPQLGAIVMREAVKRAKIDPTIIDDVRFGCCMEPVDALNTARVASLLAGIPDTVPAVTVNRVCISGLEAVLSGVSLIKAGMADVILAGGVEHMSGADYSVPAARWGARLQDHKLVDNMIHALHAGSHLIPGLEKGPIKDGPIVEMFKGKPYIMGVTAELCAYKHKLTREEVDAVALRSHNNAERATKNGDFKEEIVPVELPTKKGKPPLIFDKDEHFRPGLTMSDLAALPLAFAPKVGVVTAGNSSGINDGASALILMSAEKAKELKLTPLARITDFGRGGCHPSVMGISPVPAINDLLKRSGKKISDFDLVELNEAFAAQYLACERELNLNRDVTNVNGSGVGLGHPVGSTGSRILVTLIHALKKQGKKTGLGTLCGGGGVSLAIGIEVL